jgi:hypothetical protein
LTGTRPASAPLDDPLDDPLELPLDDPLLEPLLDDELPLPELPPDPLLELLLDPPLLEPLLDPLDPSLPASPAAKVVPPHPQARATSAIAHSFPIGPSSSTPSNRRAMADSAANRALASARSRAILRHGEIPTTGRVRAVGTMSPIPPSPPRSPIAPRPLAVPASPITLPATPVAAPAIRAPTPSYAAVPYSAPAHAYSPDQAFPTTEMPTHPPSVPPVFAPYATTAPLSRDWYVYQPDGRHLGPLSTDFLARGWVARQIPRDIFVGAAGEAGWRPISQVAEIMGAVQALEAWNQIASQPSR